MDFIKPQYRDTDGSVNIIFNFGWAGSPGRLILFPIELKATDRGTFCKRRTLAELKWQKVPWSAAFVLIRSPNCASIDRKRSKTKLDLQNPYRWWDRYGTRENYSQIVVEEFFLCLCPRGVRAVSHVPDVPVGVGELGCAVQAFVIIFAQTFIRWSDRIRIDNNLNASHFVRKVLLIFIHYNMLKSHPLGKL